jgi:hypothetical protein
MHALTDIATLGEHAAASPAPPDTDLTPAEVRKLKASQPVAIHFVHFGSTVMGIGATWDTAVRRAVAMRAWLNEGEEVPPDDRVENYAHTLVTTSVPGLAMLANQAKCRSTENWLIQASELLSGEPPEEPGYRVWLGFDVNGDLIRAGMTLGITADPSVCTTSSIDGEDTDVAARWAALATGPARAWLRAMAHGRTVSERLKTARRVELTLILMRAGDELEAGTLQLPVISDEALLDNIQVQEQLQAAEVAGPTECTEDPGLTPQWGPDTTLDFECTEDPVRRTSEHADLTVRFQTSHHRDDFRGWLVGGGLADFASDCAEHGFDQLAHWEEGGNTIVTVYNGCDVDRRRGGQ